MKRKFSFVLCAAAPLLICVLLGAAAPIARAAGPCDYYLEQEHKIYEALSAKVAAVYADNVVTKQEEAEVDVLYNAQHEASEEFGECLERTAGMRTNVLPKPHNDPGSYRHSYRLNLEGYTPASATKEVLAHLPRYFPLKGITKTPMPNEVFPLRYLGGAHVGEHDLDVAPVRVVAVAPNGFSLESLPGHPEGAYRVIDFQFVPIGGGGLELKVSAWGPPGNASMLGPLNDAFTKLLWQEFANAINSKFPEHQAAPKG